MNTHNFRGVYQFLRERNQIYLNSAFSITCIQQIMSIILVELKENPIHGFTNECNITRLVIVASEVHKESLLVIFLRRWQYFSTEKKTIELLLVSSVSMNSGR